jgi:hypothetical protein
MTDSSGAAAASGPGATDGPGAADGQAVTDGRAATASQAATANARALDEWSERLTQALQILDLKIDHTALLALAAESTREVAPTSGPITTFIVGYAAGIASASGEREVAAAVQTATETASRALAHGVSEQAPASDGWSDTAQ